MKKHLPYFLTILLFSFLSSCKEKLPEAELEDFSLEGIWLTDPSLSDDINAFKYIVFEGTTLHFYNENEIGNREYFQYQYALIRNGDVRAIEIFVKGIPGTEMAEDWSDYLYYKFSGDGNTVFIEGLAMTFVGSKVSDLPERNNWITDIVLSAPEYTVSPTIANFMAIDIAKNSVPASLTVLGSDGTDSYLININKLTGEIISEIRLGSGNYYSALTYGGKCQNLLANSEKSVEIIDCMTTNPINTLYLPDMLSIWAICSDENYLWLSCYQGSKLGKAIVRTDMDGNKIDESVTIANSPNSMTHGSDFLWLLKNGFIHKVDPTTMITEVSYKLPGNIPFWGNGIEHIDGYLLVVDNANQVYKFTPN